MHSLCWCPCFFGTKDVQWHFVLYTIASFVCVDPIVSIFFFFLQIFLIFDFTLVLRFYFLVQMQQIAWNLANLFLFSIYEHSFGTVLYEEHFDTFFYLKNCFKILIWCKTEYTPIKQKRKRDTISYLEWTLKRILH